MKNIKTLLICKFMKRYQSISKDDYIKAYQKIVDIRLIWRIAYQQMKSYTLISREGLYKKYQRIVDINVFRNIVDIKKYWNWINVILFFCIKVYQKLMCIKVHQISSFILTISGTGLCWKYHCYLIFVFLPYLCLRNNWCILVKSGGLSLVKNCNYPVQKSRKHDNMPIAAWIGKIQEVKY